MEIKTKICKHCKREFSPKTSLQTICSYNCYKLWSKDQKKQKTAKMRLISGKDEDALRRKADAIFQQVCKRLKPVSILSGEPTEVIHHRVKKSESNNLRYYMPNGVPLTNKEHDSIHSRGKSVELEIDMKMGQEWLEDLNEKRKIICKFSPEYLKAKCEELEQYK